MRQLLAYSIILTLLAACSGNTKVSKPQAPLDGTEKESEVTIICDQLVMQEEIENMESLTRATVTNIDVQEGCVCIDYQYSGCSESEALLVWDGIATKSTRPQVNMNLYVKDTGACDQLLLGSTCFSMKKMQTLGTQVLIFLNESERHNFLMNYEDGVLNTD